MTCIFFMDRIFFLLLSDDVRRGETGRERASDDDDDDDDDGEDGEDRMQRTYEYPGEYEGGERKRTPHNASS